MKKTIKKIGTIGTMTILLFGAYLLGATHAKAETIVKETEKIVEVVPSNYIDTQSEDFYNNFIDMRQVADFTISGDSLQLYFKDGSGYYWEK